MNDTTQTNPNPESKPFAFCQNCGKPLDQVSARVVGQSVFCEPCLAARVGYNPVNNPVNPGAPPAWSNGAINAAGPNPGLAALLGLIPGVGAMYNEQYAKGIAHLFIFAVLVAFSHASDIFVLFVFGWIAYMSIEAHHTAKARRDGTPLPNPFGLNDIGERLGVNATFRGAPYVSEVARDAAQAAQDQFTSSTGGFGRPYTPPPPTTPPNPTASTWGSPTDYTQAPYTQAPYTQTQYTQVPPVPPYTPPYNPPYTPPYTAPFTPTPVPIQPVQSRFPAGAAWLIGLGTIFLLGTTGIFSGISGQAIVGFALIGLGLWIFLRRMTDLGQPLTDDGTPGYQFRILRALKGSVWLALIGILFLLDTFRIVRWEYSWPWIIILAGVMMVLNRALYNSAAAAAYMPHAAAPTPTPATSTSIIPTEPSRATFTGAPTDTDTHQDPPNGGN